MEGCVCKYWSCHVGSNKAGCVRCVSWVCVVYGCGCFCHIGWYKSINFIFRTCFNPSCSCHMQGNWKHHLPSHHLPWDIRITEDWPNTKMRIQIQLRTDLIPNGGLKYNWGHVGYSQLSQLLTQGLSVHTESLFV